MLERHSPVSSRRFCAADVGAMVRCARPTWQWRILARRAWWGLLILVHIAPLWATISHIASGEINGGRLASLTLLGTAVAFFALKLIDVPCLRMRRSGVLVFALVCALVHDGAAPEAGRAVLAELPTAVAMSAVIELLSRAARWMPKVHRFVRTLVQSNVLRPALAGLLPIAAGREALRLHLACLGVPRAPPAVMCLTSL